MRSFAVLHKFFRSYGLSSYKESVMTKRILCFALFSLLTFAACEDDHTIDFCDKEADCARGWCVHDFTQKVSECREHFANRRDTCVSKVERLKSKMNADCFDAYNELVWCLTVKSKCGENFEEYIGSLQTAQSNKCKDQLNEYKDTCKVKDDLVFD